MSVRERCVCLGCMSFRVSECTDERAPGYGGFCYPYNRACERYTSRSRFGGGGKRKAWHKVRTLDDMFEPGARLIPRYK